MSDDSNLVQNRRARHDYEILETFDAGMCLKGTEIKSLRMHDVHLNEAYVKILKGEVFLIGAYIGPY
ncbi:MAG: SsrA-binding protein, partial [Chlamydiia bacterium]|nr:SsrA-binding protein [Chlamydiia bacterium]